MYCPNCKHEFEGKFCPECGTKLIEKSATQGGFSINLGDANAISGGINLSDSHEDKSQHYDQRGQTNYNAQGNVNITNQQVAAQKSAREVDLLHQQEGRQRYSDACRRFYENDGVIDAYEEKELTKIQVEYDLEINWCQQEKERINALLRDNNILSKSAKYDLEDLINAIKDNDKSKAATYASRLASLIKEKNHEELQYFYHLTLATLQPEKCTSEFEKSHSRNYWHTFWSYLAYLKQNKIVKAREVHNSLDAYRSYPEDNDMLIRTAGECILGDSSAKRDFARIDEGYSPVLGDLYNAITFIIRPDIAQREGLAEKDYLFYLKNIFNYETAEEREKKAREEQEKREAEERRLKAEAEAKAKEEARIKAEQEAKRKAEEERRRKEEEAKRLREAEEARRREEAKRKDEERRRLAEEARKAKEAEARKHVTYYVKVSAVNDRNAAEKRLATILGWSSSNCRKQLSKTPFTAKSFNDEESACDLCVKLCVGGMIGIITAKNGLNESVDCSDIMSQVQVKTFYELDRIRKEEQDRQVAFRLQQEREEAKRKAEEQVRAYREEELKRKEAAERRAAEKLRLEREAKRKAEEEARRRAEEERKRAEEERARNRKTYSIKITKVTDQMLALLTVRGALRWDAATAKEKFSKLPLEIKVANNIQEAKDLFQKLSRGGMDVAASSVNGLGEVINNCF